MLKLTSELEAGNYHDKGQNQGVVCVCVRGVVCVGFDCIYIVSYYFYFQM